ncbi:hypothetical protein [Sunxiuqinia sp. sy24]|uniref:hypothetical protein n=1 Tax=Sunxiuqinia sp. sy24 TaxID=3461495 RepID=UPI0040459F68
MSPSLNYIPIYQQLIKHVQAGLSLLDADSQKEISLFVSDQQHASGAFMDRGERPDLYYSLFGYWLTSAMNKTDELERLKDFVRNRKEEQSSVDRFALMLIQQGLCQKKINSIALLKELVNGDHAINFSYQLFLFLLLFDARYGTNPRMAAILRMLLRVYKSPASVPCSLIAALAVARHEVGLPVAKMQRQLLTYFEDGIGFRAFEQLRTGDLLSMGVTLFALHKTGFDCRLMAPTCFNFIQHNFERGAFLSGDGDETRDVEYTFYGLLALGCLNNDEPD